MNCADPGGVQEILATVRDYFRPMGGYWPVVPQSAASRVFGPGAEATMSFWRALLPSGDG